MAMPLAGTQAPGFYRHKVGAYEVTVLNDGGVALELGLFSGDPAGGEKLLKDAHQQKEAITTHVNCWLVNTGNKLVMVDTGGGANFAPTLGRMTKNLAAAGADPDAIDAVVITHMHPDHIPGLTEADGAMRFKNAIVHVNGDEYAFWTSDEIRSKTPDEYKPFFDMARAAIKPYADAGKVQMHKDGSTIAPGVSIAAAPGHTVGHSMVRVSSGSDELLLWGDIVHCAALQFPDPDRGVAFDNNPELAIANRKKAMDMVTTDRLAFSGAHLPFPAIGRAARAGSGYVYVPVHYSEI
ncbi:MAG TPA: MBL fold metallo-hydrolase [Xanthobacteraceae bacterium]|nr:MBL fold metallo-hydrolase [Xanthobacteraceae bacterium]